MDTSILLQRQIKNNSEDLQNYMRDLTLWESEMKRKDKNLTGSSSENDILPPVRRKVKKTETVPKQEVTKRIPGHDYSSWDKFDVDKACEAVDNESSEENSDENDVDDNIVKREQALYEKALGNRYVQDGKWDEAISAYTRAIAADPTDAVFFANRALCYLKKKKWDEVESDCSASIELDSTYVKAYQRRAEGRKQWGKLEAAKVDLLTIIKLEPQNIQAQNDLEELKAKLKPAILKNNSTTAEQTRSIVTSNLKEKVTSIQTPTKKDKNVEKCQPLDENEPSWSTEECLVEPINKPPHLRSKKPLKRIPIKEINYIQSSKCIGASGDQIQPIIENPTVIKQVDSVPNTSTMKETLIWNKEDSVGCVEELPPPPKTSVQFALYWKKIKNSRSQCYQFLKQLRGEDLPVIFKESLESNIFSDIISVLASEFIAVGEPVLDYIEGFSQVRRFGALTLFMSLNDKSNLTKLFDHCKTLRECSEENIVRLKKLYEI